MERSGNIDLQEAGYSYRSEYSGYDMYDTGFDDSGPVEILRLYDEYDIGFSAEQKTFVPYTIADKEYKILDVDQMTLELLPSNTEATEGIAVHTARLEQFPKPASSYSASFPCIYAWFDVNNQFLSENGKEIQLYFKNSYTHLCDQQACRFYFAGALDETRLRTIRQDVPRGRICYHYVGYGLPAMTEDSIWRSVLKSSNFEKFRLETLFQHLQPPGCFIFDCDNAGVAIDALKKAQEKYIKIDQSRDWSDWFCICATRKGEKLPDDPHLPRDFLTSVILHPVKTAITCHILQHYRLTLVGEKFPLESACSHLFTKGPMATTLLTTLTAITDAIAADCLSEELYNKLFRKDKLTSAMFRHFLLAQYLLGPYRVHPVSHPSLPDLSRHPMWRQWALILDTSVGSTAANQQPSFELDLFTRSIKSFEVFFENEQMDLIRPYHLTLLYRMMLANKEDTKTPVLLAHFAAHPLASGEMLTNTIEFPSLFTKLLREPRTSKTFHSLCYLTAQLLYMKPQLALETRKDLQAASFLANIFAEDIHEETKILCSAIIASSYEGFHHICSRCEFLERVRDILKVCSPERALWLLMIIRRVCQIDCVYSPGSCGNTQLYVETGVHIQCSRFIYVPSPIIRATAVSVISLFIKTFQAPNWQCLLLALPTFVDASYAVRMHLLFLIMKFLMSFEDLVCPSGPEGKPLKRASYLKLLNDMYMTEGKELAFFSSREFIEYLDTLIKNEGIQKHTYEVALFVISEYLANDPHLTIASTASDFLEFFITQRTLCERETPECNFNDGSDENDTSDFSFTEEQNEADDFCKFSNLDLNQALQFIALRNLVEKRVWSVETEYTNKKYKILTASKSERKKPRLSEEAQNTAYFKAPIHRLAIDHIAHASAIALENTVIYFDGINNRQLETTHRITDIKIVSTACIAITSSDGCVRIWNPANTAPSAIFRAEPSECDENTHVCIGYSPDAPDYIFTGSSCSRCLYQWNFKHEQLVTEWQLSHEVTALEATGRFVAAGSSDGSVSVLDFETSSVTSAKVSDSSIFRISSNEAGTCFAVSCNGECYSWSGNDITHSYSIAQQHPMQLTEFAVHRSLPLLLFCGSDNRPIITDLDGVQNRVIEEVPNGSICAFDPSQPRVEVGSREGTLYSFVI